MSYRVPPPTLDETHHLVLKSGNTGPTSSITIEGGGTALPVLGLSAGTVKGAGNTPAVVTGTRDLSTIDYYKETPGKGGALERKAGALDGASFVFRTDERGPFKVEFGVFGAAPTAAGDVVTTLLRVTNQNIFVPAHFPFVNPVKLTSNEGLLVQKLVFELGTRVFGDGMTKQLVAGWYEVMFDNYPSLRPLFPASYQPTIDAVAKQLSSAIPELGQASTDSALVARFTPIGQRHYGYGVDPVTLLGSKPCFVQALYNLFAGGVERIAKLLKGVGLEEYRGIFLQILVLSGRIPPPKGGTSKGLFMDRQEEGAHLSLGPLISLLNASPSIESDFTARAVSPQVVSVGAPVPQYLVTRALAPFGEKRGVMLDTALPPRDPLESLKTLFPALRSLFPPDEVLQNPLLKSLEDLLLGQVSLQSATAATLLEKLLDLPPNQEPTWSDIEPRDATHITNGVVTFVLSFLLPIVVIPFGRFVERVVDVMTDGLRIERSLRLLESWETQFAKNPDAADQLARTFWWTLLEIRPDLRFSVSLQTSTGMEEQREDNIDALLKGLNEKFPHVTDGGLPFKKQLRDQSKEWKAAGWPTDGYDAAKRAFLTTIDGMLFSAPGQLTETCVETVDARLASSLKDAYTQLADVVVTELVYGVRGNTFTRIGGLLGLKGRMPPDPEPMGPDEPPCPELVATALTKPRGPGET